MNKVLILFAHPRFEKSKTNRALLAGVEEISGVTLHDLYEEYPDFFIDIEREQRLLAAHDIVVWHFPFYMYGSPALLKQWMEIVLQYGWTHGPDGNALKSKIVFVTLTAAGRRELYTENGYHRHTIREFLFPFEQTAVLCKMTFLPPFVVHGTHLLTRGQLRGYGALYLRLLEKMVQGDMDCKNIMTYEYLNDYVDLKEG
jgi:glutathione-regulated potassium-efflux system ancillary protein KefG